MKILVLSNLYPPDVIGGYELGCEQVVDALRDLGHEVRVVAGSPRTPVPHKAHVFREFHLGDIWNPYLFDHSKPITSRLLQAEATLVNAFNVHALTRAIEEFRPDVAYAWNLIGIGGVGLMATLQHMKIPWVWHLMDDVPVALCRHAGRTLGPLRDEVARQLDGRYLACSRQLVDEIEEGGIRLRPDVEIVPNWVVGPPPPPRARSYRAGSGDVLRIMAAGQVNRNKGTDHLIEGACRARAAGHEDFVIDVYGNADDPFFLALARARDVGAHVRFLGPRPQSELAKLYLEYDVFAFPTWAREPFAFAPLEASWRGCVPVMSRQCGNAEWFVHGVHCLKIERNPDALAAMLGAIMDGEVDLGPIARRGASVVGRDFHLSSVVPKIERTLALAAARESGEAGTASDAYRMALLAEKLTRVFLHEAVPAG